MFSVITSQPKAGGDTRYMEEEIIEKLEYLRSKHRMMDDEIDGLEDDHTKAFALQRLKKEKLKLKDEINRLESLLYPDLTA